METKRKQFVEKYDKTVGTISDFFFFFKKNYPFFDNNQIVVFLLKPNSTKSNFIWGVWGVVNPPNYKYLVLNFWEEEILSTSITPLPPFYFFPLFYFFCKIV